MVKKILLVDDNEDLRYSVIEGLKIIAPGLKIVEADSGRKAMSMLKDAKIDAILLDIMMPGMDGWDVAAKLKASKTLKNVPLLFLTAKTDEMSRSKGKAIAEDYIEKPVSVKELKRRIEQVVGK